MGRFRGESLAGDRTEDSTGCVSLERMCLESAGVWDLSGSLDADGALNTCPAENLVCLTQVIRRSCLKTGGCSQRLALACLSRSPTWVPCYEPGSVLCASVDSSVDIPYPGTGSAC